MIATSKTITVFTTGGKYTNVKSVKVTGSTVRLKKKGQKKLKVKTTNASGKLKTKTYRKLKYESSDTKIATVSAKGVIKGIKRKMRYIHLFTKWMCIKK